MILANVIFPAPSAVYIANIFFPLSAVLALAAEFAVFLYSQRGIISKPRLLGAVVVVNLFSWVVGLLLSLVVPSGLVPKLVGDAEHPMHIITEGTYWTPVAIAGFFWACLVSFGLEYGALRWLGRKPPFQRLGLCVGVANVVSYCMIAAVVAVHLHLQLI